MKIGKKTPIMRIKNGNQGLVGGWGARSTPLFPIPALPG